MVCNNIKLFKNPEINGGDDMMYLIFNTYTFIGAHLWISQINMHAHVNVSQNYLVDTGKYSYTCILFHERWQLMDHIHVLDWYPKFKPLNINRYLKCQYTCFYYNMFLDIIDLMKFSRSGNQDRMIYSFKIHCELWVWK